jgi:molecular chaperone GrpE
MSANRKILHRFSEALKALGGGDGGDFSAAPDALRPELTVSYDEITRLRKEFSLLKEQSSVQLERAADEAHEALFRQLAVPMATLSAMQARHRSRGELNPEELLQVVGSFGKILAERGMEPIGRVGEEEPFDPSRHQMLDGSRPQPGEPVLVRFAGFRFRNTIVAKTQAGSQTQGAL